MGLAGASTKRKISDDPRNTRWKNDTSAPGFRMLTAMGWKPESTGLNPETAPPPNRKALSSIPSAKEDTLGIGASRSTTASSVFAAFGSRGLKFVTASREGDVEVERHRKTEGGEFGSLLDRLNASASASASASPAPEPVPPEVKRKKKRKREEEVEQVPIVAPLPVLPPPVFIAQPGIRSRARHLAAKRMATSSPADLAGILGYEMPAPSPLPLLPPPAVVASQPLESKPVEQPEDKRKKGAAEAEDVPPPEDAATDADSQAARKAARKAKRKAAKAAAALVVAPVS